MLAAAGFKGLYPSKQFVNQIGFAMINGVAVWQINCRLRFLGCKTRICGSQDNIVIISSRHKSCRFRRLGHKIRACGSRNGLGPKIRASRSRSVCMIKQCQEVSITIDECLESVGLNVLASLNGLALLRFNRESITF